MWVLGWARRTIVRHTRLTTTSARLVLLQTLCLAWRVLALGTLLERFSWMSCIQLLQWVSIAPTKLMYKKMKTPPQQGHPLTLIQKWFVGMTYKDRGCKHKVHFLLRKCFRIVVFSRTFPPAHSMHGHVYLDNRMTSTWTSSSCHNCRCFKHWNSLLPSCGVRGGSNCDMKILYKQIVLTCTQSHV